MKPSKSLRTRRKLISQAFVYYLLDSKQLKLTEPLILDEETEKRIYTLYKNGVLPIRISGLNT